MNQTAVPARLSLPLRPLFTITILLGSFLLFLIQPLFGRLVLPVLGGSPSVWNTAMLFYQAALLGGYLYAHALSRFSVRRQMLVHLGVFAVAALTLPIGVADIGASPDGAPTFWLIGLLTVSIGPVFFAVSAQAPLMQSWFSRSGDRDAANPYFLYSASNLGSFAALLAYPLLVEPMASLGTQTLAWSAGFVALALCVALCGLATGIGEAPARSAARPATSWAKRGRWTLLAAVASGLLLSTTTHLTTDIMAMPLLWVLPLSIYLLSFVLVFSGSGPAWTRFAVHGAPLALITLGAWVCMPAGPAAATVFAAAGLLLLFIIAVALHGTLAAEKPQAEGLTDFYLWMSVGGAMGGVFCALVAPVIFNWPFEHPLLLIAAVLLVPTREPHAFWQRASLRYGAAAAALLLSWGAATRFSFVTIDRFQLIWLPYLLAVAALALLTMAAVGRRKLFAWCFAMLILSLGGWNQIFMSADGMRQRSFFGVYTVEDRKTQDYKALMHGTTMHGLQSDIPAMKTVPMTYYAPQSGVGLAMAAAPAMFGPAARIGFVGLGAGTLACYRQPGQTWTAFEIDPVIENIARKDFSYISRCAPDMKIAIGDARLTLANQPRGAFNLLAVDAFSSDAIPLHLVTREAFAVYGRTLADDGVLLIHISNRFLNLEPVIAAIAKDGGWQARARTYSPVGAQPRGQMFAQSTWIVLSRSTARLDQLPGQWRAVETDAALPVWRDDFASVLPVLRFRRDTH